MGNDKAANRLTDRSIHSIGESLREFGYGSLTDEYVREISDKLLAGEDTGSDVIAMFIGRMLVDAGILADPE